MLIAQIFFFFSVSLPFIIVMEFIATEFFYFYVLEKSSYHLWQWNEMKEYELRMTQWIHLFLLHSELISICKCHFNLYEDRNSVTWILYLYEEFICMKSLFVWILYVYEYFICKKSLFVWRLYLYEYFICITYRWLQIWQRLFLFLFLFSFITYCILIFIYCIFILLFLSYYFYFIDFISLFLSY